MDASAANASSVVNALTIDVEDYFQVSAFAPYIARSTWEEQPCRIEQNIDWILELLAESEVHATFFTLGWIAERHPQMVQRIVSGGHELASHGYAHERTSALEPAAFFADVALAKAVLEDIAGIQVQGYRAPSFSIGDDDLWAYDCLAKAGYRYSSSVYPIRHDHYGSPDRSRFAHMAHTHVLEVPIATARLFQTNIPAAMRPSSPSSSDTGASGDAGMNHKSILRGSDGTSASVSGTPRDTSAFRTICLPN